MTEPYALDFLSRIVARNPGRAARRFERANETLHGFPCRGSRDEHRIRRAGSVGLRIRDRIASETL